MNDKAPIMPHAVKVEKVGQHTRLLFRCDDRNGFVFCVVWSWDGDLWLSIQADPDHEDRGVHCQRVSGTVRLRVPMIGGGSFEHLMPALIDGLRAEWQNYVKHIGPIKDA